MLFNSEKFCLIQWQMPDGKVWDRRVDPVLFSNTHRDYEVLQVYNLEKQEEKEPGPPGTDGDRYD
jgi:hypothetical protein